ncbi:MAG: hypothetical protein KDD11_12365 [Acidobacteria bacterium]|nr:hypothetical protein [Acidobacteriota bacterium]
MSLPVGATPGEREELIGSREVFAKLFDNHDGTITVHTGVEPLHYRPEGASLFEDIDPTLVADDGWVNTTNSFPVRLPASLGEDSAIELGRDFGVRWRPGVLFARLLSGIDVPVAHPVAVEGTPSEDVPDAVVYRDVYPGISLQARVRRGGLELTTLIDAWTLPFAPEQIDYLFIEADLEIDPGLLEAVGERLGQGETADEVPLYLGRADDEWVISVEGDPGIPEPQLEEYADALVKDEQGISGVAPPGWRSALGPTLAGEPIRHFFRVPGADGVESVPRALTARFVIESRAFVETRKYFGVTALNPGQDPSSGVWRGAAKGVFQESPEGIRGHWLTDQIAAAKGSAGRFFRSYLFFFSGPSMVPVWRAILADPTVRVSRMSLGIGSPVGLPTADVVALDWNSVIGYSALEFLFLDKDGRVSANTPFTSSPQRSYTEELRPITGGDLKVSTWSFQASTPPRFETIAGKDYLFGDMSGTEPRSTQPRAFIDLKTSLDSGFPFTVLLAQPYDRSVCSVCTAAYPDPLVQALAGDYRVGAELYDVRLELTLANTVDQRAEIEVTSVGGHDDRLYPGETLAWDLRLASYNGPADSLELTEVPWPSAQYDLWFSDPASGAVVDPPRLAAVGDSVRLNLRSTQADPSLYAKVRSLITGGSFVTTGGQFSPPVRIPVTFKAPEAQPTYTQLASTFDRSQTTRQVLARYELPTAGLRGTAFASTALRLVSGPRGYFVEGDHWSRDLALTGSPGQVYVHPWKLPAGTYTVELTPCLHPAGLWAADPTCVSAQARQFSFSVTATPPVTPPPTIDFVAPWSLDAPSGGQVQVSIFGQNVGGGSAGTTVSIPGVVSGAAPVTGSTATRSDILAQLAVGTQCGPRTLELTTAGGTDTATFNVTRPFQGSPHHFAVEAEAGDRNGTVLVPLATASGGQAVGLATPGAPGELKLRFRVPATSSTYQLYALYSTPEANAARADLTISAGGNAVYFYKIALNQAPAGEIKLAALYDSTQTGPPTLLSLSAGITYELKLEARPGQRFPIFDLLVLSDGSLPPTLAELCR